MKVIAKTSAVSFPRKKIQREIAAVLPKGKQFELRVAASGIGNLKIVRVVTNAWKTKPHSDRIGKVLEAVRPKLTPREEDGILRFSVLTPAEYDELVLGKTQIPKKRKSSKTEC